MALVNLVANSVINVNSSSPYPFHPPSTQSMRIVPSISRIDPMLSGWSSSPYGSDESNCTPFSIGLVVISCS